MRFLSTSREVRGDMKCWVVSDTGNQWSVEFEILVVILILP